ncbi:MAG: DNA-processing protein DprA [Clostridia bacterium]|nr:DNA-processing protein DprA [Clostridia bacterium]
MIKDCDKAYIFLSALSLSYKKENDILEHYENSSAFLSALINDNDEYLKNEFGKNYQEYRNKFLDFSFETFDKYLVGHNIGYITIECDKYPSGLLQLDQPPHILYYRGDISLLNTNCIAIVGTRSPTFYGKDITTKFAKELCEEKYTIVSGLAMGVDKIAHETALKYKGKTIAVLGNGFLHMYPAMNQNLANQIVDQGGLIITEYYPSFKACNYSFPARNRIIAALSQGILITEAAKKSGTWYTKDFAIELGKEVFAVPGNITSIKSEGTNFVIKAGHAHCVTNIEDILFVYGKTKQKTKQTIKIQLNFEEQNIYNFLQQGDKSFDEIQIYTNLSVQNLNTCLTTMQIRGIIKKLPGNYYSV